MLRPCARADLAEVRELVVAAGMFTADEALFLDDELSSSTDDTGDAAERPHVCLVDEEQGRLRAVVYYRPEDAADRVWDLTMIAVHPSVQGLGIGRDVLRHVEADLADRGARLLAVRTSGSDQYRSARAFYRRSGYEEVARVPDWWTDDDDLVLFCKRLTA